MTLLQGLEGKKRSSDCSQAVSDIADKGKIQYQRRAFSRRKPHLPATSQGGSEKLELGSEDG